MAGDAFSIGAMVTRSAKISNYAFQSSVKIMHASQQKVETAANRVIESGLEVRRTQADIANRIGNNLDVFV